MNASIAILAICIGLPLLAVFAVVAMLSHFGPEYFNGDDWDCHP